MREISKIVGPRLKIQVLEKEDQKTKGGIIVNTGAQALEDTEIGVVVQLGDLAYADYTTRWCDVGDKVLFQRYAGKPREEIGVDGKGKYMRILKDIDIIAVIETVESHTETSDDKVMKLANKISEVTNE